MKFTKKEAEFLHTLEEARIATSHNDIPHVKPVSFVFYKNNILIATDYKTRTLTNIKINSNAGIVIDIYKSGNHQAICLQGEIEVIEKGEEFEEMYNIFYEKFDWVRREPWKENEAPFLKFIPKNKKSWGLE